MSVAEDRGELVFPAGDAVEIVASTESDLASIRRSVCEFVAQHEDDTDIIADLELAASELATNVMQHSSADTVMVVVRHAGRAWELDVSGADELSELRPLDPPSPTSRSGRGLIVVEAIMDEVELTTVNGRGLIRCRKYRR